MVRGVMEVKDENCGIIDVCNVCRTMEGEVHTV